MFGAILKGTNSYFQKGMTFCRSIYAKKVMKLLAFIFHIITVLVSVLCSYILVLHSSLNRTNSSPGTVGAQYSYQSTRV